MTFLGHNFILHMVQHFEDKETKNMCCLTNIVDDKTKNEIVFCRFYDPGEEIKDPDNEIVKQTRNDAFEFIRTILNEYTNTTIYWYAISNTTSDFIIYINKTFNSKDELFEENSKYINGYKYLVVENGVARKAF